ncbi:hypothetical protein Tco_1430432, partial [Tanacetum coccineum]
WCGIKTGDGERMVVFGGFSYVVVRGDASFEDGGEDDGCEDGGG